MTETVAPCVLFPVMVLFPAEDILPAPCNAMLLLVIALFDKLTEALASAKIPIAQSEIFELDTVACPFNRLMPAFVIV